MSNLAFVRTYLAALEQSVTGTDLALFFTPDARQIEYPNQLVVKGAERDLPEILAGALRGQSVVSEQRFDVKNAIEAGDTVALEVIWTATPKVLIASLAAGDTMQAYIAMFLEVRDGRIAAQHNYDCYAPF